MVADIWQLADELITTSDVVIDRPKGSAHPRVPEYVYPVDYGYLRDTRGGDGAGIDIWVGTGSPGVTGVFWTLDPIRRDAEVKLLSACTQVEIERIERFYEPQPQRAMYVARPRLDAAHSGRR